MILKAIFVGISTFACFFDNVLNNETLAK